MPCAVILTALTVEYLAVRTHLTNLREVIHPQGTIYEQGSFAANDCEWEVGIAEVGAGNSGTAAEAERAIAYFKPDILFFVGIAGGIKDVEIGDVVVATDIYGYEAGKSEELFSTRPKAGKSAYALVQRAKSEARKGEWIQRLATSPAVTPHVFVAPIAAGEKVIASRKSEVFQLLRTTYNDAIAVEMEGFGFLSAAFAYPDIKAIVIRGISDLIEGKNNDSVEPERVRQKTASRHASAFAFEVLAKSETILSGAYQRTSNTINEPPSVEVIEEAIHEKGEADFSELERQLAATNYTSTNERLYQALLKLGYRKQVQLFRKFVEKYPIAAFLIHGKVEYGQRWLLNRLIVQHTRDSITGKVIKFNLARVARKSSIDALWQELRKQVGLGRQSEISAIVERVYQWWRTQNVLLIFSDVDFLPETFLAELLEDFWMPLTTQAERYPGKWERQSGSSYKLLMFLVDHTGCVGEWSVPFAEAVEDHWKPRTPVKLPVLSEFTTKELAIWLEFSADELPLELADRVEELAKIIWQNSEKGVPEPTFEEICQRVGLNWCEAEDRWMRL
jgi:nucleoside phosphorylase